MKQISTLLALSLGLLFALSTCKKEDNPSGDCPDCPTVSTLSPNFGSPGDTITINGKNFGGLQRVSFDNKEAEILDGATATSAQVIAPDLGKNGAAQVVLVRTFQSPSGGAVDLSSEAVVFTYAPEKAAISSLTPNSGSAGTLVTILGQRFDNVKAVRFNKVDGVIQAQTPTQITVVAPTISVTGPVEVVVVTQFDLKGVQQENLSAPAIFTYAGAMGILDFNPKSGKKDDLITISGFGFETNPAAIQVEFNGKTAEVVSVTDGVIEARVPVKAGSGTIRVTRANQSAVSAQSFTYLLSYDVSTVAGLGAEPGDVDFLNGRIIASVAAGGNSNKLLSVQNDGSMYTEITLNASTLGGGFRPDGKYVFVTNLSSEGISYLWPGQNTVNKLASLSGYWSQDIAWLDNDRMVISSNNVLATILRVIQISNGAATSITVGKPRGVTVFNGEIYVTEPNSVSKVISNTASSLAGATNVPGYADGPLASARFLELAGIAIKESDKIYVADKNNHCIRLIDLSTGQVTTIAGTNTPSYADGPGPSARFNFPQGLCFDNEGNLLVADSKNARIRKITIE